jgi:transposase-like protein
MAARAVLSPRDATERNPYSARFKLSAVRAALARPVWRRIVPTCREFGISSLDLLRDWIKDRDEIESLAILEEIVDTVAVASRAPDSPRYVVWPHNCSTAAPTVKAPVAGKPPPTCSHRASCPALSARQRSVPSLETIKERAKF